MVWFVPSQRSSWFETHAQRQTCWHELPRQACRTAPPRCPTSLASLGPPGRQSQRLRVGSPCVHALHPRTSTILIQPQSPMEGKRHTGPIPRSLNDRGFHFFPLKLQTKSGEMFSLCIAWFCSHHIDGKKPRRTGFHSFSSFDSVKEMLSVSNGILNQPSPCTHFKIPWS